MKVAGARVVVTGAGSGIGRATALRCSRGGGEVVCVDIDGDAAQRVAAECGGEAHACDVSDASAVHALADALGPVDVLVNNAGVGVGGPFLDASVDDWDWLMGVNLDGVAYGCRAFGAKMVARRHGHIVNVASGAAFAMSRDLAAYCASKAAVVALSRCLRADWAGSGVGVSVICPGLINTAIHSNSRMVGPMRGSEQRIARVFGRGRSPDVVAKAIVGAVERNREIVPVGLEAEVAFRVLPLVPGRLQSLAARARLP